MLAVDDADHGGGRHPEHLFEDGEFEAFLVRVKPWKNLSAIAFGSRRKELAGRGVLRKAGLRRHHRPRDVAEVFLRDGDLRSDEVSYLSLVIEESLTRTLDTLVVVVKILLLRGGVVELVLLVGATGLGVRVE